MELESESRAGQSRFVIDERDSKSKSKFYLWSKENEKDLLDVIIRIFFL